MAPNRSKDQKKPQAPKASFDEAAALSRLTAKIDQNLSQPNGNQSSGKRKRRDREEAALGSKKRQTETQGTQQSDRDPGSKSIGKSKSDLLLKEIKALGGDEADLELVAGIDSDADEGQSKSTEKPADANLQSDLAKFAAELGLDKFRDEAAIGDSGSEGAIDDEAEEAEEDDDEDDDDDEEEKDELETRADIPKSKPEPSAGKLQGRKSGKLMLEPRPDWHGLDQEKLPAPSSEDVSEYSSAVAGLKAFAKTLVDADASAYRSMNSSSSSHRFMSSIMSSGTMSDKVSALTLEIQESPVHNIRAFESLISLAGKRSRGQAIAALGALADLLGNGVVLPSDRRLRAFHTQPGLLGALEQGSIFSWKDGQRLPGKITNAHLIMWAFEDRLKEAYFEIIKLLEVWGNDEIEYSRSRALDFVFGLLRDKPEQEANLLRLLVNKLGDRERKIASRASYLILQLLTTHPGMKSIVIRTVEHEILLRPGQNVRAKYYAINTLNQTILSGKEPAIADSLVRIYFEVFLSLLKSGSLGIVSLPAEEKFANKGSRKGRRREKTQGDVGTGSERDTAEKLVSAILTGVNRAIPFAMTDESTLEKHLDTLFKITHSSNFNTSVQALMLIQQVAVSKHLAVERFYRTLYESLLDPRLLTSSKQALYLNLLFRSLKNDVDVRRVKAFVKRMLQVANLHQPSFTCGVLYLIVELETGFPALKTLLNEPEDNDDDGEEVYADIGVNGESNDGKAGDGPGKKRSSYDGRKRDPEYSNAQQSCLWELVPYFGHFHPTVAAFASNLLVRQKSLPKPDLANHTLIHFLDKFVYRNAKITETRRGASIMQPMLAAGSAAHIVASGKAAAKQQQPLNSAAFWDKKVEDVAAEDVFFHEYFSQIGKPGKTAKSKKAKKEAAAGDASDSEAEDEIWQALVDSRPDVQGNEDADADMDMDMSDNASDLGSLLDMSDSDDGEDSDGDDAGSQGSGGGVEFHDFSDDEVSEAEEGKADQDAAVKPGEKGGRMRRKELKALPVFASADDYAAMLGAEEDEEF